MSGYTGPDRRADLGSPSRRLHEVTLRALERTPPREARPTFGVDRVKGVGGATVIEWHVAVPVCDEYPTAELAHAASMRFAKAYEDEYGEKDNLATDLRASVKAIKK